MAHAITLDRSKPFGECRGERTPEDPHYKVAFWQGGKMNYLGKIILVNLPFDVHGELVPDDGQAAPKEGIDSEGKKVWFQPLYSPEMRAYLEAKKKKAEAAASAPEQTIVEDETEDGLEEHDEEVNLAAWLKGEINYPAFLLRAAAKKRYHKSYPNISELVVDLVLDEKLIPEDQLAKPLQKYLPAKNVAA